MCSISWKHKWQLKVTPQGLELLSVATKEKIILPVGCIWYKSKIIPNRWHSVFLYSELFHYCIFWKCWWGGDSSIHCIFQRKHLCDYISNHSWCANSGWMKHFDISPNLPVGFSVNVLYTDGVEEKINVAHPESFFWLRSCFFFQLIAKDWLRNLTVWR